MIVGSTYFFKDIKGFKSKDIDYLYIIEPEKAVGFKFVKQISSHNKCEFFVVKQPKEQLITWQLKHGPAMALGKYFIPEFAKVFDITIDDLKTLKPLKDKLDDKHKYLVAIYDAYLENKDFTLTDKQKEAAYYLYKSARTNAKVK